MIRISEFRTFLLTTLSYNDSLSFNPFPLCLAPIWRSLASLVRLLHSLSTRRLLPKHRAHDNGVWMRPQYAYAYTLNERLRVAHCSRGHIAVTRLSWLCRVLFIVERIKFCQRIS